MTPTAPSSLALVPRRASRSRLHRRIWSLAATLVTVVLASVPPVAEAAPRARGGDRILVRVKPGADLSPVHRRLGTRGGRLLRVKNQSRDVQLEYVETTPERRDAAIRELLASGQVEYAEPDYPVHLLKNSNDPRYTDGTQWHLRNTYTTTVDIDAPSAWDLRTNVNGIVVAVIDTGIRATHQDLVGSLWWNPGEMGGDAQGRSKMTNGIDDDGDGYIDDIHGMNAFTNSGNPVDDHGHGTHVAGVIGAMGNNGLGGSGVAWHVRIMALKGLDQDGNGTVSSVVECINYAAQHGAKIINASWGGSLYNSQTLRDAINALRSQGIIFVAACGNDGTDNDTAPLYPASFPLDNIVSVAATTRNDTRAQFSNWGRTTVDLAAPGEAIYSTWNTADNAYTDLAGTSQAAPQVVGAAALIWDYHPSFTYQQVISLILDNTDPVADFTNKSVSGGRLNVAQALAAAVQAAPPKESSAPQVSMTAPKLNASVSGSVTLSANASDNVGVVGVQFLVDGVAVGPERTAAPYTYSWDTRTTSNGSHLVSARARDAAGNVTYSLAGEVRVAN